MARKMLPHICIIISLMLLTLLVIDRLNRAMNFIDNDLFKGLLLIYIIAVLMLSCRLVSRNRHRR